MMNLIVAIVLGIGVLFGGGAATAYASQDAIPGDTLYPVKQLVEEAELTFTTDPVQKAERHLEFAQERVAEMQALAAEGRPELIPEAAQNMGEHLQAAEQLAEQLAQRGNTKAVGMIAAMTDATASELHQAVQHTAPAERDAVEYALQLAEQPRHEFQSRVVEHLQNAQRHAENARNEANNEANEANQQAREEANQARNMHQGIQTFHIRGVITSIDGENWVVGGQTITVPNDARVEGDAQVGKVAVVHGFVDPNGTKVAVEVTIPNSNAEHAPKVEFVGTVSEISDGQWTVNNQPITITDSTQIQSNIQVGDTVRVKAEVSNDGTLVAISIRKVSPEAMPHKITFTGTVEAQNDTQWTISGRTVEVNQNTKIHGNIQVGDQVLVVGTAENNNQVVVAMVISEIPAFQTPSPQHTPHPEHTPNPQYTPHPEHTPTWMPTNIPGDHHEGNDNHEGNH